MDNFFEILIYLFIIVSFVNSFLKKKKKEQNKAGKTQKAQTEIQQPVFEEKKQEATGKDILEEIQNLFNPPDIKTQEKKEESFGELWKSESYKEHYKKDDYHKPTESEHKVTLSEHTPTLNEHKLLKVKKQEDTDVKRLLDDVDDKVSNYQTKVPNPIIVKLRNEMRNRDSLKSYIVISEILGKPKALRR